jgi:putative phosphoribosyl transferase
MNTSWGGERVKKRVVVGVEGALLEAQLQVPPKARGVVVFPHASGISRSPGDGFIEQRLNESGLATFLVDLLTAEEQDLDARIACFRFDITMLAGRLAAAAACLAGEPEAQGLTSGYFAAGNGAAAALVVAAARDDVTAALVSHSGRPDLAEHVLPWVTAPTLLLVEGSDESLIGLNRDRLGQIGADHKRFVLVPSAASPFEDTTAPEEVARLAGEWFTEHFERPAAEKPKPRQEAGWPAQVKPPAGAELRQRSADQGA